MDEAVAAFWDDGAVVLRGHLTPAEVRIARMGIEANLASPSPRALIASRPDDPGEFFEDFCTWRENVYYKRLIQNSALAGTAGALLAANAVRLYHDHLLIKTASTRQPTPWHQDQPYYNIEGRQTCSFWIPVDPVPLAASLRFVAGSHLGPWLMPRSFLDRESRWFPEGSLAERPDIDSHPESHRILSWALEPGDVIAFHMLALHAASGTQTQRRVLSLRFLGDDVVHAPRRWKTSPDFPGLTDELAAGAPMDHPLFPVVWRRH